MEMHPFGRRRQGWTQRSRDTSEDPAMRRRCRRQPALECLESRRLLATTTEYPLLAGSVPYAIVNGPDGNFWFIDGGNHAIDRFNPTTLATTIFPLAGGGGSQEGITVGPDGNIWFTDAGANAVGMIDPTTGSLSEFPLPTPQADPQAITTGPDGNIWFTEVDADKIGSINPISLKISEFNLNLPFDKSVSGWTPQLDPTYGGSIAAGPDGNLWFTSVDGNEVGMFNLTTHAVTGFATQNSADYPLSQTDDITTGPDGDLWFTDESGDIWKIDPKTDAMAQIAPTGYIKSEQGDIMTGADGSIWLSRMGDNAIAMIDPTTSDVTYYPTGGSVDDPDSLGAFGITEGPGDNIWFTEPGVGAIGVFNPNASSTVLTVSLGSGGTSGSGSTDPSNATFTLYPAPTGSDWVGVYEIVNGPDGNLWYINTETNSIDRFNPTTQSTTEFPLDPANTASPTLRGLTVGPDGNIWFTDYDAVGMIDPTTDAMSKFPLPASWSQGGAITTGPDGNLWFLAQDQDLGTALVASINPTTQAISGYKLPVSVDNWIEGGSGIAVGPDGNLWISGAFVNNIGMFNMNNYDYTQSYGLEDDGSFAGDDITNGPDGEIWYTTGGNTIGSIDPATGAWTEYSLPPAPPGLFNRTLGITIDAHGDIWFANLGTNSIGMFDPTTDAITEYTVPASYPEWTGWRGPFEVTEGPDGNVWFTLPTADEIGEIRVNPPTTGTTGTGGDPGSDTGPPASSPPDSGSSTGAGDGTGSDTGQTPTTPPASGSSTGSDGSADGNASSPGAAAPVTTGSSTGTSDAGSDTGPTSTPARETPTVAAPSSDSSAPAAGAAPVSPPAAEVPPVPGDRYSFAIGLTRRSAADVAVADGAISLVLGGKPRRDVLTVATGRGRVAVSGLTLRRFDHGAGFRIFADARVATTRDTRTASLPHLLATEKVLTAGEGKDRQVDGFRVVLAEAFAPAVARGMVHRNAAIPDGGRPGSVDLVVSYLTSQGVGSLDLHARARVAPTGQVVVIART